MNNRELDALLKSSKTPDRPEEFWDDLPGRIARRLDRAPAEAPARTGWRLRLAWAFTIASVCLVAGLGVGRWWARTDSASADSFLENAAVVREMLVMFPNRVRAIVQDERGLRLELADGEDVPESTPLFLEICDGQRCATLVTFSGQAVRVAGREVTVLSDAKGGVMVVGDGFVWTSTDPSRPVGGLRIQAKEIGPSGAG